MATTLYVPARTHGEFGFSIAKLTALSQSLYSCADNEIRINFDNARMLNPFYIGGLSCLIHHYRQQGKTIVLNHEANPIIGSYMRTICFPYCYNENTEEINLEPFTAKRYLPIIKMPTGLSSQRELVREAILSAISALLQRQLNYSAGERMPLAYMLTEFSHNIRDHSGVDEGFIFGLFYPSDGYLDLCICDHGKGIYRSYLDTNKFIPISETQAMDFAINGKSTKDIPESRGFGISTSRDMLVNGLGGKLYIWSGNTVYIQTQEQRGIVSTPEGCIFQGTYIALRIPLQIPEGFNIYNFTG